MKQQPERKSFCELGIVTARDEKNYRVRVHLSLLKIETDFIRVGTIYVGPGWGFRWLPKVGTEVKVDFPGGDLNEGIISCCLYSDEEDRPPESKEIEEPCMVHESGTVLRFMKNGDVILDPKAILKIAGGGPQVARVGDSVSCPCGTGTISSGSSKAECGG